MKPKPIDIEYVRSLFYYKEGFVYRRSDDKQMGWLCGGRYLVMDIKGKKYLVHRIVWALHYDSIPDVIDHIDRDKLNNRIENLRDSDKSSNGFNTGVRADSKSGFTGVSFNKPNGNWNAYCTIKGKKKHIGCFSTLEEAHLARKKYLEETH